MVGGPLPFLADFFGLRTAEQPIDNQAANQAQSDAHDGTLR